MREKLIPIFLTATSITSMNACSQNGELNVKDVGAQTSVESTSHVVTTTEVVIEEVPQSSTTTTTEVASTTTTTTTSTTTTTEAPTTTTTEAPPSWEDLHELPKEAYESGARVGVLSVVNPDGEQLIHIPLFSLQEVSDKQKYEEQLERGAVVEVAHPDINPEVISQDSAVSENGLIGEPGTVIIPGHRMQTIIPDWRDQDSEFAQPQRVFERVDELEPGAIATITIDEMYGSSVYTYQFLGNTIVEDVMTYNEENDEWYFHRENFLRAREGGPADQELIRFFACTPKGSVKDRILSDFVRINEFETP